MKTQVSSSGIKPSQPKIFFSDRLTEDALGRALSNPAKTDALGRVLLPISQQARQNFGATKERNFEIVLVKREYTTAVSYDGTPLVPRLRTKSRRSHKCWPRSTKTATEGRLPIRADNSFQVKAGFSPCCSITPATGQSVPSHAGTWGTNSPTTFKTAQNQKSKIVDPQK